jgi:acetyl-CoA carboxylase biotin carboxylase subunit
VIVWAEDRPAALARAHRALTELELDGVPTTRNLGLAILESPAFQSGEYTTGFIAESAAALGLEAA